jgi:hypothetical protein
MESLIIGVIGAFIGAGASILTIWIQTRSQANRDRMRLVMELALEDYKQTIELARATGRPFNAPPVTLYLHYHLELAKLMEKGSLNTVELEILTRENRDLHAAIKRFNREGREE